MIETRVLKYFLTTCNEGSITKAAAVLNTTQPNLSRQLKDLEEQVNKKLFIKNGRNIQLTEEGMFLRKRALEIIELNERTENELLAYNNAVSGCIHIGAAETIAMKDVGRIMKLLHDEYPDITFDVQSDDPKDVEEQLEKGLIDFGIAPPPINIQKFDHLQFPREEEYGFLLRKDDPLSKKKYITPKDIIGKDILLSRQQSSINLLTSWMKKDIDSVHVVSGFNLNVNTACMCEAGLGYGLVWQGLTDISEDSEITCLPLRPALHVPLYFVWKKYSSLTKPAQLFLEKIQKYIEEAL